MRIGVIIPAYNVAPWISQAIWSVLDQTHRDWSLVIVDDGSTDATSSIIGRTTDPRVIAIQQPNQGVSSARNRGIAAADAEAEALLFLDGDDWLAPDALATLAASLRDAPDAVAAVGGYARVHTDGTHRQVRVNAEGDVLRRLLVRNLFVNGGHLLIRRATIDAAGGFDTLLRYGEDWEYWTRVASQGRFVAARHITPLLYVRERFGSAYHTMARDPAPFRACLEAIHRVPELHARYPPAELAALRCAAEAENDWVIGRELIRHGETQEGMTWLLRSIKAAPGAKRCGMLGLAWWGLGPFRRYAASASTRRRGTACTGIAA